MSAIDRRTAHTQQAIAGQVEIRAQDPRVTRTRSAVRDAARTLFLQKGYGGTTMEDIAELAGLTKRTLYNNYDDKGALFLEIVTEVSDIAVKFARALHEEAFQGITTQNLRRRLLEIGERLALAIVRDEVIALRRLLIGEARSFPALASEYYNRAPGSVIDAFAIGFARLDELGILRIDDAKSASAQFAYLLVGAPLDRAMLTGETPPSEQVVKHAREGVETFLVRYAARIGDSE